MDLVFICGPAAAGKLTVARALAEQTGLPLFHNHLIVDAVGAVFEFGTPAFRHLRERFWLEVFDTAAVEGRSLIFTFNPEATVSPDFPDKTVSTVEARGGKVRFIALTCSDEQQAARIEGASRAAFGKLKSAEQLKALKAAGAFAYPDLPAELTLDTGVLSPEESAARIAGHIA